MTDAKKNLQQYFKRIFSKKLNSFSLSNQSPQLQHQPNFELECNLEGLHLRVDLIIKKEYWYYDIDEGKLFYNNVEANEKDTASFLSYLSYCIQKSQESYVTAHELLVL